MTHRIAIYATFAALAMSLVGCTHCQTFYRNDGGATDRPFYRLDICRHSDGTTSTTLVCDSPTRLPSETCK